MSLGNVVSAKAAKEVVTFIKSSDLELYEKYRGESFEVQVGLHELLGHGNTTTSFHRIWEIVARNQSWRIQF